MMMNDTFGRGALLLMLVHGIVFLILCNNCVRVSANIPTWTRVNLTNTRQCLYCDPFSVNVYPNGEWNVPPVQVGLNNYICTNKDDLINLICQRMGADNCALFTPWGTRITTCADLAPNDSVFVVPDKRMFIFPTRGVSTMMDILHVGQPSTGPVVLETLSDYPRIFRLHNFFNDYEADSLINDALEEFRDNPPSPKRNSYQTSETENDLEIDANEFVSTKNNGIEHPLEEMTGDRIDLSKHEILLKSEVAFRLRRRVLDLLGVFPYDDTYSEGWQVLRYNQSQGYDIHQDWIEPSFLASHDYNSAYEGTNRFIAIYLYLHTPIEGGETVFPLLDPTSQQIREQYFKHEVMHQREKARKLKQEFQMQEQHEREMAAIINANSNSKEETKVKRTVCRPRTATDASVKTASDHDETDSQEKKKSKKKKKKSKSATKKDSTDENSGDHDSSHKKQRVSAFDDINMLDDTRQNSDEICEEVYVDGPVVLEGDENSNNNLSSPSNNKKKKASKKSATNFRDTITDPMLRRAYDDLDHIPEFAPGTWEYALQDQCLKKFTVRPQRLEALVYYVQKPNGLPDTQALHASCPIVQGQKFVAAMWVWNGPKVGSWKRNADTGRYEKPAILAVSASFEVLDLMYAKLYWEDQVWEDLWPGKPVKVNTYAGQTWKIIIGEQVVASWIIASDQPRQRYILKSEDIPVQYIPYQGP